MWAHVILRYGHSVVWVLLAGVFGLWPTGLNGVGQILGALALLLYAVFLGTLVVFGRKV